MNKVTIISGYQGSGKGVKVDEIIKGRKSQFIARYRFESDLRDAVNEKAGFSGIPECVVVLDEIRTPDLARIRALINSNALLLRKPYTKKVEYYERPELIILTADAKLEVGNPFGTAPFIEYINLNGR